MSIRSGTRTFVYTVPKTEGVKCFGWARFWCVLGIFIPVLFMTACARSPVNLEQEPWVWRQGPGNVDEVEGRPSTEPSTQKPNQVSQEPRPNVAENQARVLPTEPTTADMEVSGGNKRYTQAVRYGNQLYVSGQIPIDLESLKLVGETIEEQTQTVMDNIQRILNKNGMTMSNIVVVTLYLKKINDLDRVDGIYETYFRRTLPARTVVAVADLPRGSRLEISVVAGH